MTPTNKPRELTSEEAWQILCHEAGHAIVACHHDLPFLGVKCKGEDGEVEVGGWIDNPGRRLTHKQIEQAQTFYAAGAAAERLVFGRHRERAREYGSKMDRLLHGEREKLRSSSRPDGWEQDIIAALTMLDRGMVELLAKELKRHHELTREEVYKLLGRKVPW